MIVTRADLNAHLGFSDGEDAERDALLDELLTRVEGAFLAACGRRARPFQDASATPRTETYDGTGSTLLVCDAPVEAVSALVIGADPEAPRETLTLSNLVWRAGSALVQRRDGLPFGALDEPAVVHVTYTVAGEDTTDAQLAILRASAALYLQRGAEDVRSESEGGVRSELAMAFDDPTWMTAVAAHREPMVG